MPQSVTSHTSSVLEYPAPLVGRFGVNMKKGHSKERITLNNGDPLLSPKGCWFHLIFLPFKKVHTGLFCLPLCPRQQSFAKALILRVVGELAICGKALEHYDTVCMGTRFPWTGMLARLPLGVGTIGAHKSELRVHPMLCNQVLFMTGGRAWTWKQFCTGH